MPSLNVITDPHLLEVHYNQRYQKLFSGPGIDEIHDTVSMFLLQEKLQRKNNEFQEDIDILLQNLELLEKSISLSKSENSSLEVNNDSKTSLFSAQSFGFFDYTFNKDSSSTDSCILTPVIEDEQNYSPFSQVSFSQGKQPTLKYTAPLNGSVYALSSLPNAFYGWARKQSHSHLFSSKPIWKDRFVIQANASLYLFTSDNLGEYFYDAVIITRRSSCIILSPISMKVCGEVIVGDDVLMNRTYVRKSFVLSFLDEADLGIWHDVIITAIDEAKEGRRPLSYKKESRVSPTTAKSDSSMDDERDRKAQKSSETDIYSFLENIQQMDEEIKKKGDNIFLQKPKKAKAQKILI